MKFAIFCSLVIFCEICRAQPPVLLKLEGQPCCWDGSSFTDAMKGDDLYTFASDKDAVEWVKKITSHAGLEPNFDTRASNVPNAVATIQGAKRLVLYNPRFMADMDAQAKSNWGSISILAHEIGHHLQGHTLEQGGSRPPTELEADKFSGFILARMGATLDEACAAMRTLPNVKSDTHPPSSARVVAITTGWKSAKDLSGKAEEIARTEAPKEPVNQVPLPQRPPESNGPVAPSQPAISGRIVIYNDPNSYVITTSGQIFVVSPNGQFLGLKGFQSPPADPRRAVWDIVVPPTSRLGVTAHGQIVGPQGIIGYVTAAQ